MSDRKRYPILTGFDYSTLPVGVVEMEESDARTMAAGGHLVLSPVWRRKENGQIEVVSFSMDNVAEPAVEAPRQAEPCLNPNPWPEWEHGSYMGSSPPCGRPKGHDISNFGGGTGWGEGHSVLPREDDPPVKKVVQKWVGQ